MIPLGGAAVYLERVQVPGHGPGERGAVGTSPHC